MEKNDNDVLRSLRDDDQSKGQGKLKESSKTRDMDAFRVSDRDEALTTNVGVPVEEDDFLLKAGDRGPGLMQDFQFFQKIMHFTKERIPERVVPDIKFRSLEEYLSADEQCADRNEQELMDSLQKIHEEGYLSYKIKDFFAEKTACKELDEYPIYDFSKPLGAS